MYHKRQPSKKNRAVSVAQGSFVVRSLHRKAEQSHDVPHGDFTIAFTERKAE